MKSEWGCPDQCGVQTSRPVNAIPETRKDTSGGRYVTRASAEKSTES